MGVTYTNTVQSTYEWLGGNTLSSDSATWSISGTWTAYTDLIAIVLFQGTWSTDNGLVLRTVINGASNFNYTYLQANDSGTTGAVATAGETTWFTGRCASSFGSNTQKSQHIIRFPQANNTTVGKTMWCQSNAYNAQTQVSMSAGSSYVTSAISSMTFSADAANVKAGSRVDIYGLKGA